MADDGKRSLYRTTPPFRADQVGSLLRPDRVKAARLEAAEGRLALDTLRTIENEEISRLVRAQKEVGLEAVTDGELRRAYWHFDFLENLVGVESTEGEGIRFQGAHTGGKGIKVAGKVDFGAHPFLDDFRYLHSVAGEHPAKMTIPSPSMLHFRGQIDRTVYPDLDLYFADVARAYQKAIHAFYEAGCRYLQLDDTAWAYLCSDEQRSEMTARGWNPQDLESLYAETLRIALADRPSDMRITMHICRGNFRSTWIASGGYEPVAETLFQKIPVDGYFLEYDSERAGGFEPLRFVTRPDLEIVLGLVTTKTGEMEEPEAISRRVEEATRFVPLDQLCLSPQCGFASTQEGNVLTEAEQWDKLRFVVEMAQAIWGYGKA